jgi:hypothetical protein
VRNVCRIQGHPLSFAFSNLATDPTNSLTLSGAAPPCPARSEPEATDTTKGLSNIAHHVIAKHFEPSLVELNGIPTFTRHPISVTCRALFCPALPPPATAAPPARPSRGP